MLSIRIVSAGAVAAIAVVLAVSGATAQTATSDQPGKPLALLAGLRPPHETKAHATKTIVHAKTADTTIKKTASKRSGAMAATKLASRIHHKVAARQSEEAPLQAAAAALPANDQPVADATLPTDIATAAAQTAAPDNEPAPSALLINGQTVQVAASDQVNTIDLAADDVAAATATPSDRANAAPAAQAAFAAPAQEDASQNANAVGSASWIAQVLAALGGAVAAGSVAWFLIGSGPVRTYG